MKDEGLRAPGLLRFTPTLPLIPGTRLHNSYVVTDHPQPASLESQPMTQGGGNDSSDTDADAASFIYFVLTWLNSCEGLVCCTVTLLAPDLGVVQRRHAQRAEVGLIFPTSYHFQIFPPLLLTRFQSELVSFSDCIIFI